MIVTHEPGGAMLLVRQPDHAAMAAQIARAWRRPAALPAEIWPKLLAAVRRHDDGWTEAEQWPTLGADGRPLPFNELPTAEHVGIWRRGIDLIDDSYEALLIAQHARWLYTHYAREESPDDQRLAQRFIDSLTDLIADQLNGLSHGNAGERVAAEPANLMTARRLLSFCDTMSLSLLGAVGPVTRTEPLAFDDKEAALAVTNGADDAHLRHVSPWPFADDRVTLTVACVRLGGGRFDSPEALAEAVAGAERVPMGWTLTPGC